MKTNMFPAGCRQRKGNSSKRKLSGSIQGKPLLKPVKTDLASRLRDETAKNLTDETQEALTARLIEKNMASGRHAP